MAKTKKKTANKKTKKKAVKKSKKKTTRKKTGKREPAKPKGLWPKIHAVSKIVREVESTGTEQDSEGNEYNFTQAKEIFKVYGDALNEVGLTFLPVRTKGNLGKRFYEATVTYEITDIDTGESKEVEAIGLGCNGVWCANSAQTVARKQALLNAFGASYGDNESPKNVVRKQMQGFNIKEIIELNADPVKIVDDIEKQADEAFGKKEEYKKKG